MALRLHIQNITSGSVSAAYEFVSDQLQTVKIGRLSSAQLRLEDSSVSRIHAAIEIRNSQAILTDMGSGLGTSVNGEVITQRVLCHGDTILLGKTSLLVGLGSPCQTDLTLDELPVVFGEVNEPDTPSDLPGRPVFDNGEASQIKEVTRITPRQLELADQRRGVSEKPATKGHRALELRLYWGQVLLRMEHYLRPRAITIGEGKNTDIFLSSEGLPIGRFPIIRFLKDEYILTFTNHMEGELEIDGQLYPLQSLKASPLAKKDKAISDCYQVVLPVTSRCLVHWGGLSFALRFVPPFKPFSTSLYKTLDFDYLNTVLFSFFFHLAVIVALLIYPIRAEKIHREILAGEPDRFVSLILSPPPKTRVAEAILARLKQGQSATPRRRAKKNPKKMPLVQENSPNFDKKSSVQKRLEMKQRYSKLFEDNSGSSGGIIGKRGGGGNLAGRLSRVIGTMGKSSSSTELAGLGLRRDVLTGGHSGNSKTVTSIGTSGRLGGGERGDDYGQGLTIGQRAERPEISLSTPTIMGALSKEVVQRVINRNRNQIRYCYEIELQRNQELAGRIALRWVILATGRVGEVVVRDSTMRNSKVERCMMNRIRTWLFPTPAGGGVVEVNYPFVFRAN